MLKIVLTLDINDPVFNNLQRPIERTCQVIWDVLQDYDRIV